MQNFAIKRKVLRLTLAIGNHATVTNPPQTSYGGASCFVLAHPLQRPLSAPLSSLSFQRKQSDVPNWKNTRRKMNAHRALALLFCLSLLSACGAGGFAPGVGGILKSIQITPSQPSVPLGLDQQF